MRRLLLLQYIFISLIVAQTDGEVVKNVQASQTTDGSKILNISYDLESSDTFTAYRVYVSIVDANQENSQFLTVCTGDVWELVYPGENKQISCHLDVIGEDFADDEAHNISGDFYINIHADGYSVSEVPNFNFITVPTGELNITQNYYNQYTPPNGILPNYSIDTFEMMKNEVTSLQYVNFLLDLINNAVTFENQDIDWGIQDDVQFGAWRRKYTFENGRSILIEWEVAGNSPLGYGTVYGWDPYIPQNSNYQPSVAWLNLSPSDYDPDGDGMEYAKIQFSGGMLGSDDVNFFITEGMPNHPIARVSYEGAMAFADFYGLSLPSENQWVYALFGEYWYNDFAPGEFGDYSMILPFYNENGYSINMTFGDFSFLFGDEQCTLVSTCGSTTSVDDNNGIVSAFGFNHMIGNVSEHLRDKNWADNINGSCFNCNFINYGDGFYQPGIIGMNYDSNQNIYGTPILWIAYNKGSITNDLTGFRCIKIPQSSDNE